ncbi:MAG: hypothetical protein SFV19_10710 [Rhodospirillaceae bacterium]|nr:hypothetical protein [Rhodospirillaceae bacterium]
MMRLSRASLGVVVAMWLATPAQAADCTVGDIPSAGVTGFQEAVLSVADLKAATDTWREVGDFEVICQGKADAAMAEFWGVAKTTAIDQVVLRKKDKTRGFIRLVKFNGVAQEQIRSSGMSWDTGGIFDIYMYVDDVTAVFGQLRARGWQSYNDPVTYTLGPFTVTEVMMRGPNGEVLCLMQRDAPPYDKAEFGLVPGAGRGFGWPFNAALVHADYGPGENLFANILGWKMHLGGDSKSQPPGDNPLGLPKNIAIDSARKFAAYAPHDTDRNGSIQVIANVGIVGRDFADRAEAPNLGILTLRVPVADLSAFATDFAAKGGVIAVPARDLDLAPYGKVKALAAVTPNGARIEFFENK